MNEDFCIKEIMAVGKQLVEDYLTTSRHHTASTFLPEGYHLIFTKVWHGDEVNACIYDFKVSSEPLLVFGPNVYDSRLKGVDANYWSKHVIHAKTQFQITKALDNFIGVGAEKGVRLSKRMPAPVKPTRPKVEYLTNDQPNN